MNDVSRASLVVVVCGRVEVVVVDVVDVVVVGSVVVEVSGDSASSDAQAERINPSATRLAIVVRIWCKSRKWGRLPGFSGQSTSELPRTSK